MRIPTLCKAIAAAISLAAAAAASAQTTANLADMTVKGTIIPAACTPSFTGTLSDNTLDFGTIQLDSLKANAFTDIGTQTTKLTIRCPLLKRLSFTVTDMQANTRITETASLVGAPGTTYVYGLGTTTVGGKEVSIGSFSLQVGTPVADGQNTLPTYKTTSGGNWSAGGAKYLVSDASVEYGALKDAADRSGTVNAREVTFPLTVKAALNKGSLLQVAEDTQLDGRVVFAIGYN